MEESISSSRTTRSSAFYHGRAASEESGWTAYFEDYLASEAAAREKRHGVCASASTGSTTTSAKMMKKKVKVKAEKKKVRVGGTLGQEDPLEDTASSPPNVAQVDAWGTSYGRNYQQGMEMESSYKIQDVWKNIGCGQTGQWRRRRRSSSSSSSSSSNGNVNGMGQVDYRQADNELQKRVPSLKVFEDHHRHGV